MTTREEDFIDRLHASTTAICSYHDRASLLAGLPFRTPGQWGGKVIVNLVNMAKDEKFADIVAGEF
jgi:hypothetical protein